MALPQEKLYTLADVLAWDEEERTELLYGVPVLMAPPVRIHQRVLMELSAQLHNYLKGKKCSVYPAPFAVRPFELDGDSPDLVDTMVEPDISVVCDPGKLDDIGCKGAPDLVIEILSPSTKRYDRITKFNLYQRAGVREYWIVNPAAQEVQSYILEDGRYLAKEIASPPDKIPVHVLDGCVIDLTEVFPDSTPS